MEGFGDLYQEYATDEGAEEAGVWMTHFRGVDVKVRSMRSKTVEAAQAAVQKRNQGFFRLGEKVPDDVLRRNAIDLCVAIIADWRKKDGTPIDCSETAVRTVCGELRDFREEVIGSSGLGERFRKAFLEDVVGNASAPSAPAGASADV